MINRDCGGCPFYMAEDADIGVCKLRKETRCAGDDCGFFMKPPMTREQAVKVLHEHQVWRRGGKRKMLPSFVIGCAIDTAIRELRKVNKGGE